MSVCVCDCADNQRTTFACRVGAVSMRLGVALVGWLGEGEGGKGTLWTDVARSLSYQHFGCDAAWHLCEFYVRLLSWL